MDAAAVMGLQVHGALCEPTTPPPLAQSVQPRWQRGERGSVARVDKLQWRQSIHSGQIFLQTLT